MDVYRNVSWRTLVNSCIPKNFKVKVFLLSLYKLFKIKHYLPASYLGVNGETNYLYFKKLNESILMILQIPKVNKINSFCDFINS